MSTTDHSTRVKHEFRPLDRVILGAYAYLCNDPKVDTAVIFVHGFRGHVTDTWEEFQSMIDTHVKDYPKWAHSDAFFFTYSDSIKSIDDSVDQLRGFVDMVFPAITGTLEELLGFRRDYRNLILVGHSEGAVVIRAAVAYAGSQWVRGGDRASILDARLSLFAPAQFGFVPTSWIGLLASTIGLKQVVEMAIRFSTPATEMLDKTVLLHIKDMTYELWREHQEVAAFSAHVLFGSKEHVVLRSYYLQDCRHRPEPRKSHTSICKPRANYPRPLEFVMGDCPK